jgi:hypothetical protein
LSRLLLLLAGLVLVATAAMADTTYGPVAADVSRIHVGVAATGSGSSPADPVSLTLALERATQGDEIILASGEYTLRKPVRLAVAGLALRGSGEVLLRFEGDAACALLEISAPGVRLENLHIDASRMAQAENCERPAIVLATGGADALRLDTLRLSGPGAAAIPGAVELPDATALAGILLENTRAPELRNLVLTRIPGTAIRISGASERVHIGNTEISDSGHRAIHLLDSDGSVQIISNRIQGALNEGIFLHEVTGSVLIAQNEVEDIRYLPGAGSGAGIEGGIVHTNTRGRVNLTIRGNTVDIDPRGETRAHTGVELLDIDGIEVNLFGTARGFALVEGNVIRNTEDDGIDIDTLGTAQLDVVIRDNVITNVHDRAMSVVAAESSVLRAIIEGNEIMGPARLREHPALSGDGIGIRPRQDSVVHVVVRQNEVINAGRKGIDINMNRGSGGRGPVNTAQAFFRLEANNVHRAAQRGLDVQLEDRAVATGILTGNSVHHAAGDGIRMRSGAGDQESVSQVSRLHVAAIDNDVRASADAGEAGVLARAQHESSLCLRLADNRSHNPAADQDYMIRSQHDARVELSGLTSVAEPADPSEELRAALVAAGNTGRQEAFPARVRGNGLHPPGECSFPPDDYLPELPSPSPSPSPSRSR